MRRLSFNCLKGEIEIELKFPSELLLIHVKMSAFSLVNVSCVPKLPVLWGS